jgi:hypothetical protein
MVSLNSAFEKVDSQSSACYEKEYRNTLQNPAYGTIYRITGGFLYAAKKQFEEGYWKNFHS